MKKNLILLILILIFNTCYSQEYFNFNQGEIKEEKYYSVIPYSNAGGFVIVGVEICGKKYNFMLDTGASAVISSDVYKALNIQPISNTKISDGNNNSDSLIRVQIPNIKLGELNFVNTPAVVAPITGLFTGLFSCHGIDGIIGSSMFRNSIIRFSSKDSTIMITNLPQKLKLDRKKSIPIELTKGQSLPLICIKAKNKKTIKEQLLFDSGMNSFYQISLRHFYIFNKKEMFNDLILSNGGSQAGIFGFGNDTILYFGRIPEISINKVQFKNISTITTNGQERLGAKLFDYGIVTIDFIQKRFYFEPYEKSYDLYEKEYPIGIIVENGKILIGTIWYKNLKDQIKRGDNIVAIDGIDYTKFNTCEIMSNLKLLKNKETVVMTIQSSDGSQKEITIKKEM